MPRITITTSQKLEQAIKQDAEKTGVTVSQQIAGILAAHYGVEAQDAEWGGRRVSRWWPYFPANFELEMQNDHVEKVVFHSAEAFALWYAQQEPGDVTSVIYDDVDFWQDANLDLLQQLLIRGEGGDKKLGVVWMKTTSTPGSGLDGRHYSTKYATDSDADFSVDEFIPGNTRNDFHSKAPMPESLTGWQKMYVAYS